MLGALSAGTTTGIFTLAGALGAVVITGGIGLLLASINNRAAEKKAAADRASVITSVLRQERREAYAKFLVAADNAFRFAVDVAHAASEEERRRLRATDSKLLEPLAMADAELSLVAPHPTSQAATRWREHMVGVVFDSAPPADWVTRNFAFRDEVLASMRQQTMAEREELPS